jgi:hypothetical protein
MTSLAPFAIELGDFTLDSATPLTELGWLAAGLLILAFLTFLTLRWYRQTRPDPFYLP